jgi:hypothetical protein
MCDRQVAMLGDGAIRDLPGGVEQYLDLRQAARLSAAASGARTGSRAPSTSDTRAGARPVATSGPSPSELREAKKDLGRIERQLTKLSAQEERIHVEMAAKAADHVAVLGLNDKLRAIVEERETLELEWLSVADFVG